MQGISNQRIQSNIQVPRNTKERGIEHNRIWVGLFVAGQVSGSAYVHQILPCFVLVHLVISRPTASSVNRVGSPSVRAGQITGHSRHYRLSLERQHVLYCLADILPDLNKSPSVVEFEDRFLQLARVNLSGSRQRKCLRALSDELVQLYSKLTLNAALASMRSRYHPFLLACA